MARTQIDPTLVPSLSRLLSYRRPHLVWNSVTQVEPRDYNTANTMEILFPDGQFRSETSLTQYRFDITRNAVLSGSKQSGLRTGLSEATNTWYAIYAVKATDSNGFCLVGDTLQPIRTNTTTLNTNFGTNGWVYLGMIRNGDGSAITGDILRFGSSGGLFLLGNNPTTINGGAGVGMRLAASAAATTAWTYAAGSSGAVVPDVITQCRIYCGCSNSGSNAEILFRSVNLNIGYGRYSNASGNRLQSQFWINAIDGVDISNASFGSGNDINLSGWFDPIAGNGNSLLF